MVYCTKCGTENPEDAESCSNCGASLQPEPYRHRRDDWDRDDDCFGGRSRTTWPLIFGVFLILIGLSSLLEGTFWWLGLDTLWPLFLVAIGVIVITNAMKRR